MITLMLVVMRLLLLISIIGYPFTPFAPFLQYKAEIIMIMVACIPVASVYYYYIHIQELKDRNRKLYSELKLTLKEHNKLNKKYVRICEKYDVADQKYLKKLLPHLCNNCCVEQKKRLGTSASSQTG